MRWTPGGRSKDLEDLRGQSGGGIFSSGGARMGLGGTVVLLVLSLIFGRDFISGGPDTGAAPDQVANGTLAPADSAAEEPMVQFVSFVLDDVQSTWDSILPATYGVPYTDAKLVLFRNVIDSGCGVAQTTMGPFYCPSDDKVYIDLGFYQELKNRFGAPGDFAQAYVIAHELGHHVQDLLGTEAQVHRAQENNPDQANELSVRLELQADCYAGVWGHSAAQRNELDPGDAEEGINAAAAVGDDRLQRETTGHVDAESFTHGTSAQRVHWFEQGLKTGNPRACDTFAGGAQ